MIKLACLGLMLVLSGCTHLQPRPSAGCAFVAYPLHVGPGERPLAAQPDLETIVRAAMSAPGLRRRGAADPTRPSVLVLSGGSQHGAFGAGFFAGLPIVPDYKLVTGVSTGALQSTFLFLANQPVPADRTYPAYFHARPGAARSNTGDLAAAYAIEREGDLLRVGPFGQAGGVVRGSIGDFAPLRAVLRGLLSPGTLRAVGADYRPDPREGRRLLVGVTGANDGAGYAIDLTELASRLSSGSQSYPAVRDCYVDALIASSSVPLAVPPVTLELRDGAGLRRQMFIDGGARFGVFWSRLGEALEAAPGTDVTLIVNGLLYETPWLNGAGRPRTTWSALTLGFRAVEILENQVYRFSVEAVKRAAIRAGSLRLAFISGEGLPSPWTDPDGFRHDGRTCRDWMQQDERSAPAEFHPRYMQCLVAYGRERGRALAWNLSR